MALNPEEAETSSIAQRLDAAKRSLEEKKNGTKGTGSTRHSNRAFESGSPALDGAIRSIKTRTSAASSGDRDFAPALGDDKGTLGSKRKSDSGYSPSGGRVSRNSSSGSQDDRQASGKTSLLRTKDQTIAVLKRALTYAGFDLKGDARALTEREQQELHPKVSTFFKRLGVAADWAITHTNRGRAESNIWMLEDDESDTLATIYLKRARKIGWMAEVARQVEHLEDVGDAAEVAEILGKRLVATGMFYPSNGGFQPWL